MGGAVYPSNGGSQPAHLTNRTSNANKQPPIAGNFIRRGESGLAAIALRLSVSPYTASFASHPLLLLLLPRESPADLSAVGISRRVEFCESKQKIAAKLNFI